MAGDPESAALSRGSALDGGLRRMARPIFATLLLPLKEGGWSRHLRKNYQKNTTIDKGTRASFGNFPGFGASKWARNRAGYAC